MFYSAAFHYYTAIDCVSYSHVVKEKSEKSTNLNIYIVMMSFSKKYIVNMLRADKKFTRSIIVSVAVSVLLYYFLNIQHGQKTHLKTPEDVIANENYTCETHQVETEDGYLLTAHRIPNPSGPPVFLQHGLLSSSIDWLKNGRNRSLAFFLSDHGYDVWIGNSRGNTYSKNHKTLSPADRQFWNFSWHEMGIYDDAAYVSYITNMTGKKLFYIGYSMGTSSFSIMASEKTDVAKNVAAMVGLAPAVYMNHIDSPFAHFLATNLKKLQFIADLLGIDEFFKQHVVFDFFADTICNAPVMGKWICSIAISGFVGPEQLDHERLPIYFSKYPSGTSFKSFCHLLQLIEANEFQNFDYGQENNLKIYNNARPPKYSLSNIQVPIAIFISDTDPFINKKVLLILTLQLFYFTGIPKLEQNEHFPTHFFTFLHNIFQKSYVNLIK
ncbi:unnamed protein product [Trichogramma brassicae]|uniref:Partial AB-hydrolase lipase domain-containing protein n=1 Tax=Trichogramma brassicae TaxID=86971 RepID=A0A6H5II72_9HYME|nr:unnamed protein product [Trichogramma brassicae]